MRTETLRKMHRRAPFRPFRIHLTNGDVLPVEHPETMALPDDANEFALWVGADWNLIDADQVARVSLLRRNGGKTAKA